MTLKQEVHALVDAFADDAAALSSVRERLRLDLALAEALEDVAKGRTLDAESFAEKVASRWPARASV